MKNKTPHLLSMALALLVLGTLSAHAATTNIAGVTWTYDHVRRVVGRVLKAEPASGNMTVPATLGGRPTALIGTNAFESKYGLTGISFPNSMANVGDRAFFYCTNLVSVSLGTNLTTIGNHAFYHCGLRSIAFPPTLRTIGKSAFGENNLTSVFIPASVSSIGVAAFAGNASLTSISVAAGNTNYMSQNGDLFSKDGKELAVVPGAKGGTYQVSSSVRRIWGYAFSGTQVTSIVVPDTVEDLDRAVFRDSSKLVSVVLPSGLKALPEECFYECYSLRDVPLPPGLTGIPGWAFLSCQRLSDLSIPSGVTNIGYMAFYQCYSLTTLALPPALRFIDDYAFARSGLTELTIPPAVEHVGKGAFSDCAHLAKLHVPETWRGTDMLAQAQVPTGCEIIYYKVRGSYHDPDGAFWDVEFGAPGAALGHGAYAAAVGGTAIGCTTNAATGEKTWWVTGSKDPGVLQRAVDQAQAGDTIQVAPGCYDPITVGKDRISIVSRKGRMQTFINGKYAARCVDFGSTKGGKITGFTLVQGNAGEGDGGGIRGGSASYCLIEGCRAAHGGGAALSALSDCFVTWNTAGASGGGVYGGSLLRCEVRHNEAAIGGGAVATTATGTLFAGNEATTKAGGAEQSTLMACTVADNRAKSAAGVSGCTVKNSLLHGNRLANGTTNNYVSSTCQYTCAWPVPAGTGNFNAPPNFVNQAAENYHLNNYSKCRDKANKTLSKTPWDLAGLDRAMGSNADAGACEYATGVTPLDPADYDGDGQPDVGFFNPANGTWFVKRTSDGTVWRLALGNSSSKIVPRDYNGDGMRDPAVYDPNTGTWTIRQSGTGDIVTKKLGWKGITLVDAADWDGDGKADPIIFNPASTTWQILQSRNGETVVVKNFGTDGVKLFCGDYDGDGYADLAYYVTRNYRWYVRFHDGYKTWVTLGASGVRPCPVDLDQDGALDAGYFDPSTGKWTVRSFMTRTTTTVKFGDSTTTPHPYDWNNDGVPDTLGVYSPYRAGFLDLYKNADGTTTAHTINF